MNPRGLQLRFFALFTAFLIGAAGSLLAQSAGTAGLTGTIFDPSGAAVPSVTVTLTSSETGQVRTTTSGTDGVYRFALVPPGTYRVRFVANGFRTAEVPSVTLNVTESATLDGKLEVGAQSEAVTVNATAEILQASNSTLGTTVGSDTVTELPLANRNYTQILGLSAGANGAVNDAVSFGKGTVNLATNGNDPFSNNFQMDGVAINGLGTAGGAGDHGTYVGVAIPSPDAIQEFKIQTSTYDASYGRNPGANVNVTTRSGTNTWHGTGFEFFRNGQLDANDFFYNRDICRVNYAGQSCPKQVLSQNQYGGVIGGPIKKNKLFIFGSYEGTKQKNGIDPAGNASIPLYPVIPSGARNTPQFVSALIADNCHLPAFGPALPCTATSVSPVALKMLQVTNADGSYYFPSNPSFGPVSFNVPALFSENQYLVNGDYAINEKNTLAMRFFWSGGPRTTQFNTPAGVGAPPGAPLDQQFSNTNAVLKLTTVVTNTLVNEARVSGQRLFSNATDSLPAGWTPQNLGITPIVPGQTQGPILYFLINSFGVGGSFEPALSPSNQFQYSDQISWFHGKHTIRAGFELEQGQWNIDFAGLERGWLFIGSFSNLLAANNPGNIASCVGCVAGGNPSAGGVIHAFRQTNISGFVQDDWKLSPRLTVNLGVRWEYDGTFSDKYGNLSNTWLSQLVPNSQVPSAPLGLAANYAGWVVPGNFLAHYPTPPAGVLVNSGSGALQDHPPLSNFAPRVGFAYQINSKLVIRGGAGLFYDRVSGDALFHGMEQGFPADTLDYSGTVAGSYTIQNPFPQVAAGTNAAFPQRYANLSPACLANDTLLGCNSNISTPYLDEDTHTPLVRNYNLSLQYEFAPHWVLETSYVGSSGINLVETSHQVNAAGIASANNPINGITTTTTSNVLFRVPYLGYAPSGLQGTAFDGIENYNSLQITVRKRFSHGLMLQGAYTWSKSLTDILSGNANSNDPLSLAQQYGPSYFNRPQRFILNYSWAIPVGKHSGVTEKLLDGWNLSGVTTIQDGQPMNFFDLAAGSAYGMANDTVIDGIGRAQMCPGMTYANIPTPGGIESRLGGYSGGPGFFNTSAFCPVPAIMPNGVTVTSQAACPTCATLFGNSGAGIMLGMPQFNFDASLLKSTKITERTVLQFRAEFFNALNHPQFADPATSTGTPPLPSMPNTGPGQGTITHTSVSPRIIQLGLKLMF